MKQIQWIIQNNLINPNTLKKLELACKNYLFRPIQVIPFSNDLPILEIDDSVISIFYGSTTFIYNLWNSKEFRKSPGLFFDPRKFTVSNYNHKWGINSLNCLAKITTFEIFTKENHPNNSEWFIRPNSDSKFFAGNCLSFEEIKDWYSQITNFENETIAVSSKKQIDLEWRLIIVNGKVVTSCLYRDHFNLRIDRNSRPIEMIKFAEECCEFYQPAKVFVMDIGRINESYKIIECNCFNMSGFYDCDLQVIVDEVSKAV